MAERLQRTLKQQCGPPPCRLAAPLLGHSRTVLPRSAGTPIGAGSWPRTRRFEVRIDEVHLNHDTGSATSDALNIRTNGSGTPIVAPEWKHGMPSKPAAYARFELGAAVTIRARITGGPPNGSRRVRAIDPWIPPASPGGCLGWLVVLIAKLVRALFGNVLGEVTERTISFDASGDSGLQTFTLKNHKLKVAPVGIRQTTWTWQVRDKTSWTDIGSSQHKIYVVLHVPKAPWEQSGVTSNNVQLPWAEALEKSCAWALGANSLDEAAERITKAVNTRPNVAYTPATIFGSTDYNLTGYLHALDAAGNFVMNCRDCANAVATLSNLLGTDLHEGVFSSMTTRPFLTLGGDPANPSDWVIWSWGWHEIVWVNPTMGSNGLIYDGCLRVDVDDNYTDAIHIAKHPIKMEFGTTTDGVNYRYRLIDTGTGNPSPPTRRRPVV